LTDKCQNIWLNNQKVATGFVCAENVWTHVMITYSAQVVSFFKNAIPIGNVNRNVVVPSPGIIVLGQDNNLGQFSVANALAPGQVGAPQLFNNAITGAAALGVKSGQNKGNLLNSLNNFKVHGFVNMDNNDEQTFA